MRSRVRPTPQRRTNISIDGVASILENLAVSAILISETGLILAINESTIEISGYLQEDILGKKLKDIFPNLIGGDNAVVTIQSLPGQSVTAMLRTRDYERIPITVRLQELKGNETHFLITFEKIADGQRELTEQQLRANLISHLDLIFQAIHHQDSINEILNIGSKLLIANAFAVYFCENDSPIFRKTDTWGDASLLPKEIPPTDLQYLLEPNLWLSGERSIVTMLHHSVQAAKYAYLATAPIGNPGAWSGFIVATGIEEPDVENTLSILQILSEAISLHLQQNILVTNIQQNLDATTRQLTICETIQETIQEGVILISPDLKIIELNSAAEYILGYAGQEIYEQTVENVLIGTDRLLPAIKLALQGVPTHNLGKTMLHRRDGSSFPVLLHTTPALQNDDVLGALVILSDISEHEQTKIRTQQLEQRALLGEVTAVFAHEVRNPINNISTGLQLMAINTPEDDTEKNELISRLQQDCTRLTELMESILTFSRTGNYKFLPLSVQDVIERLFTRWRPRMARLNIQHHIQVAPDTPKIMGDRRALEQVFTNLISNAIQAMGDNGGTLAVKIAPNYAPSRKLLTQVDISDTGPGIPEEIRDRIFDPFFTTDPKGTGLGLSITKQIITAHKGSIHPTSFPGGTVFHVQIPALEAAEEPAE